MGGKEIVREIGNGAGLVILQKIHLVLTILGILIVMVSSVLYSSFRLDRVEDDIKELKAKAEAIQEMRSDIRHINEGIQEIKEFQKEQEKNIKEFYKIYKLEKK